MFLKEEKNALYLSLTPIVQKSCYKVTIYTYKKLTFLKGAFGT